MLENTPLVKLNKRIRFFTKDADKEHFMDHLYIKSRKKEHKCILYDEFKPYGFFSIIDDDTKFGLFRIQISPINTYNGKIPKSAIVEYLVYDKIKKSVRKSSGFYSRLLKPILEKTDLLKGHKFEWLLQAKNKYYLDAILSVNILKKIYHGVLTNPTDLFKAFLKEKGFYKISENDFIAGFKIFSQRFNNPDYSYYISYLKTSLKYESDVKFIGNVIKFAHNVDLINLCKMTKTKINFSWSHKRLNAVHDDLSKYVATIKSSNMKLKTINYKNDIPNDIKSEFTLLKTNKEFFIEGDEMSHCLFSNGYFNYAIRKEKFILKYEGEFGRGTAEIIYTKNYNSVKDSKVLRYSQFQGKGNKSIGQDFQAKAYLNEYLNQEDVLDWWLNEIGDKSEKQIIPQLTMVADNDIYPF